MTAPKRPASPRLEALEDRWVPAVIGGVVYNDLNANGLFDAGEQGIGGTTLQLRDEAGGLVATTTSASNGQYQFTQRDNVSNQPAVSSFDAVFTSNPTDLTRTAQVSKFDPALGTLLSVELVAEGSLTSTAQMENLGPNQASIEAKLSGMLSYQVQGVTASLTSNLNRTLNGTLAAFDGQADLQGNSSTKFDNIKLQGQFTSVTITDQAQLAAFIGTDSLQVAQQASANSCACGPGNLLSMVRTTAEGKVKVVYHYTPSNEIGPGKYTVVETQPGNYVDGRDTKDNVTPIPGSEKTDTIEVGVVNRTETKTNNNFGELQGASVAGKVYRDVDKNGSLGAGDIMLPNVTVGLSGHDVYGNAVTRTTQTNGAGAYSFNLLLPGDYVIKETQPAGYDQGTNTVGSLGGTVQGDEFTVTITNGQAGTDYNYGEIRDVPITPPPIVTPPPLVTPPGFTGKFYFFGRLF